MDLQNRIINLVKQVLGIPPSATLHVAQKFVDVGVDSLMAAELAADFQAELGISVSAGDVAQSASIQQFINDHCSSVC